MRLAVRLVYLSLASDSSEIVAEVVIINLDTVTASLRHENASRVYYIDLDLYSRSYSA